jgi:hypothetical protein
LLYDSVGQLFQSTIPEGFSCSLENTVNRDGITGGCCREFDDVLIGNAVSVDDEEEIVESVHVGVREVDSLIVGVFGKSYCSCGLRYLKGESVAGAFDLVWH